MRTKDITDLHEQIAKLLIHMLRTNPDHAVMTYGQLCDLLENKIDPRNVSMYLGDLSIWCYEVGAPMISVLIYSQEKNMPGKGFFKLYGELHGCMVKSKDEEEIYAREYHNVIKFTKWDKLESCLGL